APRLVHRRISAHERRVADPPALQHVDAQARRLRLRSPARSARRRRREGADVTPFPKMISVDDHVVEPPHVWEDRLPARMREQGPRVERARWGDFSLAAGASYNQEMTEDGDWGDYWMYE